jgi:PhzF family phenazine biosynthesis protein
MSQASSRVLEYRVVDAFAERPFEGNPAAVFLPDPESGFPGGDSALLQAIATEMNLSETAFPYAEAAVDGDQASDGAGDGPGSGSGSGAGVRRLRWFTPATEVTLCGHATLAAAHVLLEAGATPPLRFQSLSGGLAVEREDDGRLRLDFPADLPRVGPAPEGLAEALGLEAIDTYAVGQRSALIEVASEEILVGLTPDMRALGLVPLDPGVMGVSITTRSTSPGVDFSSRFFGPWVGVPEDPVTGMAHTLLGVYWAARLEKDVLEAWQRSARGGRLTVRVVGDRVHLVGSAVTVARGELLLP